MPSSIFHNDEEGFSDWRKNHPNGYVYNDFGGSDISYKKLHYARCKTLIYGVKDGKKTSVRKLCNDNLNELISEIKYKGYSFCKICRPDSENKSPVVGSPVDVLPENLRDSNINKKQDRTPFDKIKAELIKRYGDWINSLKNINGLIGAEILFDTPGNGSWSQVALGYTTSLEAEFQEKFMNPWNNFKKKNNISDGIFKIDDCFDFSWFGNAINNKAFNEFLGGFAKKDRDFLLNEFVNKIRLIRPIRNNAAHTGDKVVKTDAELIRILVLGESDKPGLLKRVNELKRF